MFCEKCGKEVQEEWAVCPQCGTFLKEEIPVAQNNVAKKEKPKVWMWVIIGIIAVSILGALAFGIDDSETNPSSFAEEDIFDKLQTFTTLYKGEDKYYFLDNGDDWALTYTSENEFVSFENDAVVQCFTDAFGEDCFAEGVVSDLGFSYDISDNEARIYLDVDIEDGHLTIVSYSLLDQEYELMIDGEKWTTTDTFTDYVKEYGLAESIEQDVNEFKEQLQQYGLTVNDLLNVKFDTLEAQFVPDVEESKVENEQEEKEENTESVTDTSLAWKKAYLDYLNEIGNTEYGYSLDYIDGDDIPELVIDYMIAAEGVYLCTYDGTSVIATPVGESLKYRLKENLFCVSGGRMDYYYDIVYEIVDGTPIEVSRGEYGTLDYENIKYDESGSMIYQYSWNGESISEYDYYAFTEAFSFENADAWTAGRGYLYDVIEVLSHPLDITMISPYLNDNGYMSLLNNYVILFDGILEDKIHFTVSHNGELIGSASATITGVKTAEYKNANSELVIEFDPNNKYLSIKGYIGTIDLTGEYEGIWG